MKDLKLIIRAMSLQGMEFDVNGERVLVSDVDTLMDIANNIQEYCEFNIKITLLVDKMTQVQTDIDGYLEEYVVERDGNVFYDVGDDFAYLMEDIHDDAFDNRISYEKLELDFEENVGKLNNIFFEAEEDFLHVYTKSEETAKIFLQYTTERWIEPLLSNI